MVLKLQRFEVDDNTHVSCCIDSKRNSATSSFSICKYKNGALDCYGTTFHFKSANGIDDFINFLIEIRNFHLVVEGKLNE